MFRASAISVFLSVFMLCEGTNALASLQKLEVEGLGAGTTMIDAIDDSDKKLQQQCDDWAEFWKQNGSPVFSHTLSGVKTIQSVCANSGTPWQTCSFQQTGTCIVFLSDGNP